MLMEGGADKRLRKRGINGKEPEGPEGQAPRKTGGNGGKEGNGGTEGEREGTGGTRGNGGAGGNGGTGGNGGEQEGPGGARRSQNKNTKDSRLVSNT